MQNGKLSLLFLLALLLAPDLAGQVMLARDVDNAEKYVAEITIPAAYGRSRFRLLWWNTDGYQGRCLLPAKAGTHLYEMRTVNGWSGKVPLVTVQLQGASGRLKQPDWLDEWHILCQPEPLLPCTVNFLQGASWCGIHCHLLALAAIALTAVSLALLARLGKITAGTAWRIALLSMLAAWVMCDLRSWYDHGQTVRQTRKQGFSMAEFADFSTFVEQARASIGQSTWRGQDIPWPYELALRYYLAEQRHDPGNAAFIIASWRLEDDLGLRGKKIYAWRGLVLLKATP